MRISAYTSVHYQQLASPCYYRHTAAKLPADFGNLVTLVIRHDVLVFWHALVLYDRLNKQSQSMLSGSEPMDTTLEELSGGETQ